MTTHRTTIPLIAAALGLLALTGCSANDTPDARVASLDDSATTADAATSATTPPSAPTDPEEAMAAFDECMADHGVELPTPESDAGGSGQVVELDELGASQTELDDAIEACSPLLDAAVGNLSLDPAEQAEMDAAIAQFDECMADAGYPLPGPGESDEPVMLEWDEEDPAFTAALDDCSTTLSSLPGAVSAAEGDS